MKTGFFAKILNAFLICSLAFGGTNAHALRPLAPAESSGVQQSLTLALSAGLEEVIPPDQAKLQIDEIRASFRADVPVPDTARHLSEVVDGLIRWAEREARQNLTQKTIVVVPMMGSGPRATAYAPNAPEASKYPKAVIQKTDVFIAVTGGMGRREDFLFNDDIDLIVFPSNPESVPYAQALHAELLNVLEKAVKDHQIGMEIDRRLTGQYEFQIPPEQVPDKLLVTQVPIYDAEFDMTWEQESTITTTPFRDLRFVSGDQAGFQTLTDLAAPLLYPYDPQGQLTNPKGGELYRLLHSNAVAESQKDFAADLSNADLKENGLRFIQYYIWLARSRAGVRESNPFAALDQLVSHGLSAQDSADLKAAYEFFLRARDALYTVRGKYAISPTPGMTEPNYKIQPAVVPQIAPHLGTDETGFRQRYRTHFDNVRRIVTAHLTSTLLPSAGLEETGTAAFTQEDLDALDQQAEGAVSALGWTVGSIQTLRDLVLDYEQEAEDRFGVESVFSRILIQADPDEPSTFSTEFRGRNPVLIINVAGRINAEQALHWAPYFLRHEVGEQLAFALRTRMMDPRREVRLIVSGFQGHPRLTGAALNPAVGDQGNLTGQIALGIDPAASRMGDVAADRVAFLLVGRRQPQRQNLIDGVIGYAEEIRFNVHQGLNVLENRIRQIEEADTTADMRIEVWRDRWSRLQIHLANLARFEGTLRGLNTAGSREEAQRIRQTAERAVSLMERFHSRMGRTAQRTHLLLDNAAYGVLVRNYRDLFKGLQIRPKPSAGLEETENWELDLAPALLAKLDEERRQLLQELALPVLFGVGVTPEERTARRGQLIQRLQEFVAAHFAPGSLALNSFGAIQTRYQAGEDVDIRLHLWINDYVLLPQGVGVLPFREGERREGEMATTVEKLQLVDALGYELFLLPGFDIPLPVIYIRPPAFLASSLGASIYGIAYLRPHPVKSAMIQTRQEELGHSADHMVILSQDPKNMAEFFGMFKVPANARIRSHFGYIPGISVDLASYTLMEFRELVRAWNRGEEPYRPLLQTVKGFIDKQGPKKVAEAALSSQMGLDLHSLAAVMLALEYSSLEGKGHFKPDRLKKHAAKIWKDNFDPADSLQIQAKRVYPEDKDAAAKQLDSIAAAAKPSAGLEETAQEIRQELVNQLDAETRRIAEGLQRHPFPIKILAGPDQGESYSLAAGKPIKISSALWSRGITKRIDEEEGAGAYASFTQASKVLATALNVLSHDINTHLITLAQEKLPTLLQGANVDAGVASYIQKLKLYADDARMLPENALVEATLDYLTADSYKRLLQNVNHVLRNKGNNPRITRTSGAIRKVSAIDSGKGVQIWYVKAGNDSLVANVTVFLKDGRRVQFALNVAKDLTDASSELEQVVTAMNQNFRRHPGYAMEIFDFSVGAAMLAGKRVEIPVFTGEWLEGYEEPHLDPDPSLAPDEEARFKIWWGQSSKTDTPRLLATESDKIWARLVETQSALSWIEGQGVQARAVVSRPSVNAGDMPVLLNTETLTWNGIFIWDRKPVPAPHYDPTEIIMNGLLVHGAAIHQQKPRRIWWGKPRLAIEAIRRGYVEAERYQAEINGGDPQEAMERAKEQIHDLLEQVVAEKGVLRFQRDNPERFPGWDGLSPGEQARLRQVLNDSFSAVTQYLAQQEQAGLEDYRKKAQRLEILLPEVEAILAGQEKTGLLRRTIGEIESDTFFIEGQVAFLPARKGILHVIGDVHADLRTLKLAVRRTGYRADDPNRPYLVFVGDYWDVGKKSLETILYVLEMFKADSEKIILLAGNHDRDRPTRSSEDVAKAMQWGARWFFLDLEEKLGGSQGNALFNRVVTFANKLPMLLVTPNGLVVMHASPPSVLDEGYHPEQGLLGIAHNKQMLDRLSFNLIRYPASMEDEPNTTNHRLHPYLGMGHWVGTSGINLFLTSIGGTVIARGHNRTGPVFPTNGGRVLTVITTDWRSNDGGYPKADKTIGRIARFDLSAVYTQIPESAVISVWDAGGELPLLSAGLEVLPNPIDIRSHPFEVDSTQLTFLNRNLVQLEWLTQRGPGELPAVLSDIVSRAGQDRVVRLALLGVSTGEEAALYWHAAANWMEANGYSLRGDPGSRWTLQIYAVEKRNREIEEAKRRFRGESPFVYALSEVVRQQDAQAESRIQSFARRVRDALQRDLDLIQEGGIVWIEGDMSDPAVIEQIRDAHLFVANRSSSYMPRHIRGGLWNELLKNESAWFITTDHFLTRIIGRSEKGVARQILDLEVEAQPGGLDIVVPHRDRYIVVPPVGLSSSAGLEEPPWYERRPKQLISVEKVVQNMKAIRQQRSLINNELEPDQHLEQEDLSDQAIVQYAETVQALNELLSSDLTSWQEMEREFLNFHATLGQRDLIQDAGEYEEQKMEEVRNLFQYLFSRRGIVAVRGDPVRVAARLFVTLVNLQGFQDGNKRTASLIMNHLLLRAGYTPFILTPENVVEYHRIVDPVREDEEDYKVNEKEFEEFLEGQVSFIGYAAGLEAQPSGVEALSREAFLARFPGVDIPAEAGRIILVPGTVQTTVNLYADVTLM
ncbi:MAG: metallophosphoesterase, partial [Candidatus Omnitrophica bacterium]|nr:metallophosphoesterase [Candidatus Omnitrophota bacterium]